MTMKQAIKGPSAGGSLTGRERPLIKLDEHGLRWWRLVLKNADRAYVGKADLPAMGFLAAALGNADRRAAEGQPVSGVELKRLFGMLSEFGYTPDGRRRLVNAPSEPKTDRGNVYARLAQERKAGSKR